MSSDIRKVTESYSGKQDVEFVSLNLPPATS